MNSVMKLIESIEHCLLPKLGRNFDESENHPEYDIRKKKVDNYFSLVLSLLGDLDLRLNKDLAPSVLSSLLIMYKELQSDGPWNTDKCKSYAQHLNLGFGVLYEITLDDLLRKNNIFNTQQVFDRCIENLHRKLTSEDFKKFPGRIEVYCSLIQNIKEYDVKLHPMKTLPVSIMLIEDYIQDYKIKGLKCCITILQCLTKEDFEDGNYYDVIYRSLKNNSEVKDLVVTKLFLEALREQMKIIHPDMKDKQVAELYEIILEQLHIESNLNRKEMLLIFLKEIIQKYTVNCASGKKMFMEVIKDNLELCTSETVGHILLSILLECFQEWIKYCWCVWKLSMDYRVLSLLIKMLYIYKEEEHVSAIQKILIVLFSLCTKAERAKLLSNLDKSSQLKDERFIKSIDTIKNEFIEIDSK